MNIHIEPRFNGAGMQELDDVIIGEELFWGCSAMATAILANNLALAPVLLGANDRIKKEFVQPMTEEFKLAAYAVTEPGAGSDVAAIRTSAKKLETNISSMDLKCGLLTPVMRIGFSYLLKQIHQQVIKESPDLS